MEEEEKKKKRPEGRCGWLYTRLLPKVSGAMNIGEEGAADHTLFPLQER